jgi:hypothetical protein
VAIVRLFDHFVGGGEQRLWHGQAEHESQVPEQFPIHVRCAADPGRRHRDPVWKQDCFGSGLATGEGLIEHFRQRDNEPPKDKRLMLIEIEFSRVLKVMNRADNIISPLLCSLWDEGLSEKSVKSK